MRYGLTQKIMSTFSLNDGMYSSSMTGFLPSIVLVLKTKTNNLICNYALVAPHEVISRVFLESVASPGAPAVPFLGFSTRSKCFNM